MGGDVWMAGSSPAMPPGADGTISSSLGVGGVGFAGRLSAPGGQALTQAGRQAQDSSRRYLRASSLQSSTTVPLSAALVLLKTIPSEMRIWPLAVFSAVPESCKSWKASLLASGPCDGLFTPSGMTTNLFTSSLPPAGTVVSGANEMPRLFGNLGSVDAKRRSHSHSCLACCCGVDWST